MILLPIDIDIGMLERWVRGKAIRLQLWIREKNKCTSIARSSPLWPAKDPPIQHTHNCTQPLKCRHIYNTAVIGKWEKKRPEAKLHISRDPDLSVGKDR